MHYPKRIALAIAILYLFLASGCVSIQKHNTALSDLQDERAQLERERAQLVRQRETEQELRQRYERAVELLGSLEMVSKAELVSELEAARIEIVDKQEKAYYKGMVDLLSGLSVIGTPSQTGWLIKTNYYTIQVSLLNHVAFSQTIETKREVNQVLETLGIAADLVSLRGLFPFNP